MFTARNCSVWEALCVVAVSVTAMLYTTNQPPGQSLGSGQMCSYGDVSAVRFVNSVVSLVLWHKTLGLAHFSYIIDMCSLYESNINQPPCLIHHTMTELSVSSRLLVSTAQSLLEAELPA